MPSNPPFSPRIIGTRSNSASGVRRTISAASSPSNPASCAVITWSAPRETVAFPGCTSMRYGTDASTSRENTSIADAAFRRYAGPNAKSANAAIAVAAMAVA